MTEAMGKQFLYAEGLPDYESARLCGRERAKCRKYDVEGEKLDGGRISKSRGCKLWKLCRINFYMSRDGWATMWHVCVHMKG